MRRRIARLPRDDGLRNCGGVVRIAFEVEGKSRLIPIAHYDHIAISTLVFLTFTTRLLNLTENCNWSNCDRRKGNPLCQYTKFGKVVKEPFKSVLHLISCFALHITYRMRFTFVDLHHACPTRINYWTIKARQSSGRQPK